MLGWALVFGSLKLTQIILSTGDEEVERNKDKDATKAIVAPNRRVLARRRIEAARA
jgi:hypothetical protein